MVEAKARSKATYKPKRFKAKNCEMIDFTSRYSIKESMMLEQDDRIESLQSDKISGSRMESIKGRKLSPHANAGDGDVQLTLGNWSEYSN